jgi:hypothetical protein
MTKAPAIFGICLFLISCSVQAPKEDEVKEMVRRWYMQQSNGNDAGRWEVDRVSVLLIENNEQRKGIFNTMSLVSGIHYPATVIEPLPEKFSDTLRMNLQWNGAKWITAE